MQHNTDKHLDTKISVMLGDMRVLWYDVNDNTRLEILKSLIWTAPDNHKFYEKALKMLKSDKFQNTLD